MTTEARVTLKISENGAEYELHGAALIWEDGRPYAVDLDPKARTPAAAKYELDPKQLEQRPNNADGTQSFAYRLIIRLPRLN